jgi:hypothetical protein
VYERILRRARHTPQAQHNGSSDLPLAALHAPPLPLAHARDDDDGAVVQLGLVPQPHEVPQMALMMNRNAVAGSLIGGMPALQDLCQFAAKHDSIYLETKVRDSLYLSPLRR